VLAQLAWGLWMQTIPKQPVGPRVDAFNLHKSLGMLILALVLVRLGWRLAHRPPPLPPMRRWQALGARASHATLYVALIAQPVIGFVGSAASGYPVRLFGVTLPALMARHDALKAAMSSAHVAVATVLAATIAVHVAAAVRHARARDGVIERMWPRRARGEATGQLPPREASRANVAS
jgi:cytochrome b561